jgi:hypothetical protein
VETASARRVSASTPEAWNETIRKRTVAAIDRATAAGDEGINARLNELDREWDIERVTAMSAAVDAGLTLGLGAWRGPRWWKWGLGFLAAALLAHVAVGLCPSLPLYRKLGFRTPREIEEERFALKLARGDFGSPWAASAETLLAQARR